MAEMFEQIQNATDDFQKMGKDNYDAMVRSYGELNKGLQAIACAVDRVFQAGF